MKQHILPAALLLLCSAASAEDTRHLHAHEHGAGDLDIAIDGALIEMSFTAPGSDIVGFEHPATSNEDKAAIQSAIEILSNPLTLFKLSTEAGCKVEQADAELEQEGKDDDHQDGDADARHSEFHVHAEILCDAPDKLNRIDFPYFARFPMAHELEVQLVSDKGAYGASVEKSEPVLDLKGRI